MTPTPDWIWLKYKRNQRDLYVEFVDSFTCTGDDLIEMDISCDGNYAVYINGHFVNSGQYPDFPHYKVYDRLTITGHCREGENRLSIIVWRYGDANMSYYPGTPGLYYSIRQNGTLLACSTADTLSRQSRAYISGRGRNITGQMGFTFHYDADREDDWMTGVADGFRQSRVVHSPGFLQPRPIRKCIIGDPLPVKCIRSDSKSLLVDLGCEQVGFLQLSVQAEQRQTVTISYGEHIVDGDVRRIIGGRDFSVTVTVPAGNTCYMNPFRRLGARYLSLKASSAITVNELTLRPVTYPVSLCDSPAELTPLQQRIYDVSVHTLLMCMHDHYEDSPWREQALYAMDGRNQILCGYYAFGEFEFARASLALMARDHRADGLLSICTPTSCDLTIPSFSLHYFTEILEYSRYSGDLSLAKEVFPKLDSIIDTFIRHMDGDVLPIFAGASHWNFYEWSDGLSGHLGSAEETRCDAALNCLFSLALHSMSEICQLLGRDNRRYKALRTSVNNAINRTFYDHSRHVYINSTADYSASELVNSLAVLCGAPDGAATERIAHALASDDSGLTQATLSMRCFKYDALLKVDRQLYQAYILHDIQTRYQRMLDAGATTFWETEIGEADFDQAGSLCHGWSAMPVYYYHLFARDNHLVPYYE